MEAFADRGYRGTSLDAVAASAGVTRQGLVHYFPSKTELLVAVLEQRDEDDRAFGDELGRQGDLDLVGALMAILRRNQEQPRLAQLFAVSAAESAQPDHPAHDYFRRRHHGIHGEIVHAIVLEQGRGNIARELDPEALAVVLLALLNGLNLQRLLDPAVDIGPAVEGMLRGLVRQGGAGIVPEL